MNAPSKMCWRSGNLLIVPDGMDLSGRCFKCGEPSVKVYKRKLYWHHPAIYILAPFALIVYAIVAIIVRKSCSLKVGLCAQHKRKRNTLFAVAWGIFALAVLLFVLAATMTFTPQSDFQLILVMLGVALILAAGIMGAIVASRLCWPSEITNRHGYIKGAGQPVLDDFAEFTGFKQ